MVVVPALIEGAALGVAMVPFLVHRWDMYRWDRDHRNEHHPKTTDHSERLTVLLPVWNEATVIQKKLENLHAQGSQINVLIVDSASTDATVNLVRQWLEKNPRAFDKAEIIEMPERKGKRPQSFRR